MNLPPAPPPAPSMPPLPPPPPQKSSALKWILIGCGAFAFLGILACGGCFLVGFLVLKGIANEAVAQVKPIITSNETVRSEIGEVRKVNLVWSGFRAEKRNGRDTLFFNLDVEGDKGRGTVEVKLFGRDTRKDEAFVTLTFITADQSKRTPIGTWRIYDDGKGNAGFTPVDKPPPDEPDDDPQD